MKYLIISILFFITTNCFGVSQKLIDGARDYEAAIKKLEKIENNLRAQGYFGLWSSDEMRKYNPDYIDETEERWHGLGVQYNEAKKMVKKYEVIKNKYDKQKAREEKIKDTIGDVAILLVILTIFVVFFAFIIRQIIQQRRKYRQLLIDGKITQEEYERMMKYNRSSMFDDTRTNPATGLTMLGGCDSGGNPAGSSFSDRDSYDYSRDYRDSHRWD